MPDEPAVDERATAIERYRVGLRHLLLSWRSFAGSTFDVERDRAAASHLAIPWAAQVHRFGRAFLHLEKQGFENEGHLLVRSALEYTVVGHWVAQTGDNAVIARYGEDQRHLRNMIAELRRTPAHMVPPLWNPERLEEYRDADPPSGVDESRFVRNFADLCQSLGVRGTLYGVYRLDSWIAHPTTNSAGLYLAETNQLLAAPRSGNDTGLVGMMAHCVYWSRRTVDDLIVTHPHREWLDGLAQQMNGIPPLPDIPPPAGHKQTSAPPPSR